MSISVSKLDQWIINNFNVLLKGPHGIGKTALIKESFERHGLKYKYFSCPTMDPWTELVGVPEKVLDEKTGEYYLDYVRPKDFSRGEVQCIFFDELNRAPAKVRNAVMELIQFRSINGKKFENLRFIWAAVNPDDEDSEYDVEPLDPAQADRFEVHYELENKPFLPYFNSTYGPLGTIAVSWWNEVVAVDPKIANMISPRRLEYAIKMFFAGGDLRDVLPKKVNTKQLFHNLKTNTTFVKLKAIQSEPDATKGKKLAEALFTDVNIVDESIHYLEQDEAMFKAFIEYIPKDKIHAMSDVKPHVKNYIKELKKRDFSLNNYFTGNVPAADPYKAFQEATLLSFKDYTNTESANFRDQSWYKAYPAKTANETEDLVSRAIALSYIAALMNENVSFSDSEVIELYKKLLDHTNEMPVEYFPVHSSDGKLLVIHNFRVVMKFLLKLDRERNLGLSKIPVSLELAEKIDLILTFEAPQKPTAA